MRTINITFEDKEFVMIDKVKGDTTWHDFILELIKLHNYNAIKLPEINIKLKRGM